MNVYYEEDTHQTSKSFKLDSSSKVKSSHLFHFVSKFFTHTRTLAEKEEKKKKRVEKWLIETVVRFSVEILKWLARKSQASLQVTKLGSTSTPCEISWSM